MNKAKPPVKAAAKKAPKKYAVGGAAGVNQLSVLNPNKYDGYRPPPPSNVNIQDLFAQMTGGSMANVAAPAAPKSRREQMLANRQIAAQQRLQAQQQRRAAAAARREQMLAKRQAASARRGQTASPTAVTRGLGAVGASAPVMQQASQTQMAKGGAVKKKPAAKKTAKKKA